MPEAAGFTPVPNALLDEALPRLKDTELRVALVVVRATRGWRDREGRAKARDWISHSQLCRRTGRGSDAVSSAVDALVGRGLLVVEDADRNPLASASERRRHLGRLYYRLGDLGKTAAGLGKTGGAPHPGKAERTRQRTYNKKEGRPAGIAPAEPAPAVRSGWQRAGALPCHRIRICRATGRTSVKVENVSTGP